jgi:hypothetical protein
LIGVPGNFTQSSGPPFYLRNRYVGPTGKTVEEHGATSPSTPGLRSDVILPFWGKYNQIQTYIPGAESTLYPWGALRRRTMPPGALAQLTEALDRMHLALTPHLGVRSNSDVRLHFMRRQSPAVLCTCGHPPSVHSPGCRWPGCPCEKLQLPTPPPDPPHTPA